MKILLLLSLSWLTLSSLAATTEQNAMLQITSDSAHVDRNKGIAIFIGHVKVDQGTTHVSGDKVTVNFDANQKIEQAIVVGNLAQAWLMTQSNAPPLHAQALTIHFYPQQNQVVLKGEARAEQAGNIITSPTLSYNTVTQTLVTPASQQGRTTIVLQTRLDNKTPLSTNLATSSTIK